jgi:hypothetical protein
LLFGGEDAAKAYNESITMDFDGSMDTTAMDSAISVMQRHEALRATFSTDGTYMTIYKNIASLNIIDLTDLEENNKVLAVIT